MRLTTTETGSRLDARWAREPSCDQTELIDAIDAAFAGDWHRAHEIVQRHEDDPFACWIHALPHKIEGDDGNSRYWYARTGHRFDAYTEPDVESRAIRAAVSQR